MNLSDRDKLVDNLTFSFTRSIDQVYKYIIYRKSWY